MNTEADGKEIRKLVNKIPRKPGLLLKERETLAVMKLSERALYSFLKEEPDLYSISDIRAAHE